MACANCTETHPDKCMNDCKTCEECFLVEYDRDPNCLYGCLFHICQTIPTVTETLPTGVACKVCGLEHPTSCKGKDTNRCSNMQKSMYESGQWNECAFHFCQENQMEILRWQKKYPDLPRWTTCRQMIRVVYGSKIDRMKREVDADWNRRRAAQIYHKDLEYIKDSQLKLSKQLANPYLKKGDLDEIDVFLENYIQDMV